MVRCDICGKEANTKKCLICNKNACASHYYIMLGLCSKCIKDDELP